tara:strand:+ start:3862 stop:4041 length:180 start_codon:yes stop_codon:yes gene_type:complete
MANTIDWGKIYCSTWFGDQANTTIAIPQESAPSCFVTSANTADSTILKADTTTVTADAT